MKNAETIAQYLAIKKALMKKVKARLTLVVLITKISVSAAIKELNQVMSTSKMSLQNEKIFILTLPTTRCELK